eukprot:GFUD01016004.1.p1 GENE.GFUD01016004.1~~GFUD01016004.1.p1  ORF type:complete len:376 (-),score=95.42 GFUD01016004.1:92-1219(-)
MLGSTPTITDSASWNALREAQGLLDLTTGVQELGTASTELYVPHHITPPPQWSITVLANDDPCLEEPPLAQMTEGESISKSMRRNKRKLKRKRRLWNHLPLKSFYQSSEDWGDLYLVRKMLGGKGQSSESEASSEKPDETESDEDNSSLNCSLDQMVEDQMAQDVESLDTPMKRKRNKPVAEMIRKKVLEMRERKGKVRKLDREDKPESEKLDVCLDISSDATLAASIQLGGKERNIYNFASENEDAETREDIPLNEKTGHQRKTKWYEMQPFEDPDLEAKRLRSLRAKINHDKNRFDLEFLKVDHEELKYENLILKAELMQKLKDEEASEARIEDLEREVQLRRLNEEALETKLDQVSQGTNAIVLVQVWWKVH